MLPCVVLAGGLGTRLRPLTEAVPKALVTVLGRPFAEIQLEWLASCGVTEVVYSIGYRGDLIRETLGDGARFRLRLTYVDEDDRLRGTAGALRLALDSGVLPQAFFVLNGDSYLSLDLAAVESAWRESECPVLMTVFHNQGRWDRSNATLSASGRVLYDKDASDSPTVDWIDYGLSVLTREVVAEAIPPGGSGDIADVLHDLSVLGLVAGYAANERFYEVGSPAGLLDLEKQLRRER